MSLDAHPTPPDRQAMLHELADGIWEITQPLRFLGMAIGTRMTVIGLPSGGLLLHSPIAVDDALARELEALGPVEQVVCPNAYHHLHAPQVQERYPDAKLIVAPGAAKKQRAMRIDATLDESEDDAWGETIAPITIEGSMLGETVLFHRPSGTLVSADLLEYFEHHDELITRTYLKLGGVYGQASWNRLLRFVYRDKKKARASIDRLLELPIERITIAHGLVIEGDAREALERGFSWP